MRCHLIRFANRRPGPKGYLAALCLLTLAQPLFAQASPAPHSALDYVRRGVDKAYKRDTTGALEDFARAIELDPQSPSAYLARAQTKIQMGNFKGAIEDCAQILELKPEKIDEASAIDLRGLAQFGLGDDEKAMADYNRAIEISPELFSAYRHRGLVKEHLKDSKGALDDYNRAIEINPRFDSRSFDDRATLYVKNENFAAALKDYNRALEINPNDDFAHYGRGLVRYREKDWDSAIADFSRAIELNPNFAMAYSKRGSAKYKKGDTIGADTDFGFAMERNPKLAAPYLGRSLIAEKHGDYKAALTALTRATELDPKSASAFNNLAWIMATAPNPEVRDGTKAISHAIKACELTNYQWTNYFDTLAAAYAETGDFDQAVRWQKKFLETNASDSEAQARLTLYQNHQPYRQPEPPKP